MKTLVLINLLVTIFIINAFCFQASAGQKKKHRTTPQANSAKALKTASQHKKVHVIKFTEDLEQSAVAEDKEVAVVEAAARHSKNLASLDLALVSLDLDPESAQ